MKKTDFIKWLKSSQELFEIEADNQSTNENNEEMAMYYQGMAEAYRHIAEKLHHAEIEGE